jgi:iron complex outermembrane receptor protein
MNVGMGANVQHRGHLYASVFISITNLTNRSYQSHLSRLKYLEVNNANGRSGVYNMGRTISLKMVLPIEFETKKQPAKK